MSFRSESSKSIGQSSASFAAEAKDIKDMQDSYHKLLLFSDQKKDLHALLVHLKNMTDVKTLGDISFEKVKDILCCPDPKCSCEYERKTAEAKEIGSVRYNEIEKNHREISQLAEQINLLKIESKKEANFYLESGRGVADLREHIEYLKKLCFKLNNEIRQVFY